MNSFDEDEDANEAHANCVNPRTDRGETLYGLLNGPAPLFNVKTRGQWRKIVSKLAASAPPTFHPEAPSRRLRGAFGEVMPASSLSNSKVAVVADLSVATSAQMLYSWLTELCTFSRIGEINLARFRFFCFFYKDASDETYRYKIQIGRMSIPFLKDAFVRERALAGAVDLSTSLELVKTDFGTRADVLIIFTTGSIGATLSDAASGYLRSMRKKTVWVLPADVQNMDDAFKNAATDAIVKGWVISANAKVLLEENSSGQV